MKNPFLFWPVSAVLVGLLLCAGCSNNDEPAAADAVSYKGIPLEFTQLLLARDYDNAYRLTSTSYQRQHSVEQLKADFEAVVAPDWGPVGGINLGQVLTDWPAKQPNDVAWVYVSIGGDVYSEAISVVVTAENGAAKIRAIEFGRP